MHHNDDIMSSRKAHDNTEKERFGRVPPPNVSYPRIVAHISYTYRLIDAAIDPSRKKLHGWLREFIA